MTEENKEEIPGAFEFRHIPHETIDELKKIDGVEEVQPEIWVMPKSMQVVGDDRQFDAIVRPWIMAGPDMLAYGSDFSSEREILYKILLIIMYWTLELASYLEDAPWPATKDELIDLEYDHLSDEEMDVLKEKSSSYGKTFMMNPKRLRAVAEDICSHYKAYIEPNGFKAQVVAFSREACAIIKGHIDEILGQHYSDVVFSGGQNDLPHLRQFHKSKQGIKDCTDLFKKKDSDLKIIIVQSMLLTGFDAPNEQVMYLDRPLKDHNLLQAMDH